MWHHSSCCGPAVWRRLIVCSIIIVLALHRRNCALKLILQGGPKLFSWRISSVNLCMWMGCLFLYQTLLKQIKPHLPCVTASAHLTELNIKFSLTWSQEKHFMLCKELVMYWCLEWRVMSHALAACYWASQFLCFGSWDSCSLMWVYVNLLPSEPLAPTFTKHEREWGTAKHIFISNPGLTNITDRQVGGLTSQTVQ